jgi:hypothetical protein
MLAAWNPRRLGMALAAVLFAGVAVGGTLNDVVFEIDQGCNYDSNFTLGPRAMALGTHMDRTVSFQCLFESSCAYITSNPADQADWCKLMGITTLDIHKNSIRLGWAWNPQTHKMALGFYGYIKGTRIMQEIAQVDLNTWVDVSIEMTPNLESVTVNGLKHEEQRSLGLSMFWPTPSWILRTAYFGGNETAPHEMKIDVRDIQYH